MGSPRGPLSVSPATTTGWSLEDDVALHRRLGLSRISLSAAKADAAGGPARAAQLVAGAGLDADVVYPAAALDLTRPEQWPAATRALDAAVRLAAAVGGHGVLVTGGAGHGLAFEDAADRCCEALAPVVGRAASVGVRLLVEAVRPQFAYAGFVHCLRDAVPLARRLGAGVVVDVTHCWWEPGIDDLLAAEVDLVGSVHVADLALDAPVVHRRVPGDGELPLPRLLGVLVAAGYQGPFELELIGPAIEAEGVAGATERGAAYTRALLVDLGCG